MTTKQKYFLILAPLFALLLVSFRVFYLINLWTYSGPDLLFIINKGDSFAKINQNLMDQKLISSGRLFHRYNQYKNSLHKFRTGAFRIQNGQNMLSLYQTLMYDKSINTLVTIPEGKNIYDIADILEKNQITTKTEFLQAVRDPILLQKLNIPFKSAEGYLYPDTYDFTPQTDAHTIVSEMVRLFRQKIENVDFSTTHLTPEQVLILASIVEKETGAKEERPIIAQVFLNRLKLKMRLQSDPTTIYGMYEKYRGNITKKDLLSPTPYNTYTIAGLPIGPISNPGIDAVRAVLKPSGDNYLYFVSKNEGKHIFSDNYTDHLKAVDMWQKNAKNREGKSWRNLNQTSN